MQKKAARIGRHILFWCFYIVLYFFNYKRDEPVMTGIIVTLATLPFHLFFTYSQLYYLIPRFLLRKRIALYLLLTALFARIALNISYLTYCFFIYPLRHNHQSPQIQWDNLWGIKTDHARTYFALLLICGIAVSIKLLKKWYHENERSRQIENANAQIELQMLKAQVHPHFLFNTLNNLYSLTLTKSEKTPVVVTHLSDLLRYMLYECNEKEVPLDKEIEMLKKYVELEKLRYGSRIDVSFTCSGKSAELLIAPLLLLPLVENAFKYGVSEQFDQCWVNIHLHAEDNQLTLLLHNSCSHHRVREINGGIGQLNTRKRLELLYPGQYNLVTNDEENMYVVKLKIRLKQLINTAGDEPTAVVFPATATI